MSFSVSIVGGSGFTGGELLRLLHSHPSVAINQVTSRQLAGQPVHRSHPNLRGHVGHAYVPPTEIETCDVLFLCMPHGQAENALDSWRSKASLVIDMSADHRLDDPGEYARWYGSPHPCSANLTAAVYGLPEVNREALASAALISGVGCNATAMTLALLPLARAGLIKSVIADVKVGSSEAGAAPGPGSHHPVRARAVRTYSPFGHRHIAEVHRNLGPLELDATITAIETVRGVLCTAHVTPPEPVELKRLWQLYREAYREEPFIRLVADRVGPNRFPDPRVLTGSNHADIGFAVDERSGRVVALCAIDNLMKGAAGSAVQSMNIALGEPETTGLAFPGLHPA
ncbi:MAG: N-acetyl-gamma-glutamyl-phosphate reductase [Phycisphaerales bacterium JB043]